MYCAPGNPGTAELAHNLTIPADDLDRLADAADMYGIDLTIVGPEVPLARGLADRLRAEGRRSSGPVRRPPSSRPPRHSPRRSCRRRGSRPPPARPSPTLAAALAYVDRQREPLVVKASGLAAGKGVIVCATRAEAVQAVRAMLETGLFGEAGRTVVIEAFLEGEEISVLAATDGVDLELLPVSQDHKRLCPATRARTPAAWAPTAPSPWRVRPCWSG